MTIKKKLTVVALSLSLFGAISSTAFAASYHYGGVWSYGAVHNPFNWGAFSNFYHGSKNHWSKVVRHSDSKSHSSSAGPNATSEAFINTSVGEYVDFDAGLHD